MKLEDMNRIYYINKEVQEIQKTLEGLKNDKNFYRRSNITGMPKIKKTDDMYAKYMEGINNLEETLYCTLAKLQEEREQTEKLLGEIKDPEARIIARLRVINNMNWGEIGQQLNMDRRTASRKFYALFEDCPQCPYNMC